MPSSRGSSHIYGAGIAGGFFIAEPTEKAFGQLGCCKNYNQQGNLHSRHLLFVFLIYFWRLRGQDQGVSQGDFLGAQWLRLHAPDACVGGGGGRPRGPVPDRGTEITHAELHGQQQQRKGAGRLRSCKASLSGPRMAASLLCPPPLEKERDLLAGTSSLKVKMLVRHVRLSVTPWTVAHQAPLSMGFSRQEYWSGLTCPSPGDLSDPGIEPQSPTLQAGSSPSEPPGTPGEN